MSFHAGHGAMGLGPLEIKAGSLFSSFHERRF
jgi:hypothetical protein